MSGWLKASNNVQPLMKYFFSSREGVRPSITMLGVDKFFLWGALIVFMKYSEMLGADIKSRSG